MAGGGCTGTPETADSQVATVPDRAQTDDR